VKVLSVDKCNPRSVGRSSAVYVYGDDVVDRIALRVAKSSSHTLKSQESMCCAYSVSSMDSERFNVG
jgi:hypothetical protein